MDKAGPDGLECRCALVIYETHRARHFRSGQIHFGRQNANSRSQGGGHNLLDSVKPGVAYTIQFAVDRHPQIVGRAGLAFWSVAKVDGPFREGCLLLATAYVIRTGGCEDDWNWNRRHREHRDGASTPGTAREREARNVLIRVLF
jgi:hypothetical protein